LTYLFSFYADSQIDREMLNILEENARLLNEIEVNILTSQVGLLFLLVQCVWKFSSRL